MSAVTEINDYLMEKEPDIIGLVETKLSEEIMIPKIGGGNTGYGREIKLGKRGVEERAQ